MGRMSVEQMCCVMKNNTKERTLVCLSSAKRKTIIYFSLFLQTRREVLSQFYKQLCISLFLPEMREVFLPFLQLYKQLYISLSLSCKDGGSLSVCIILINCVAHHNSYTVNQDCTNGLLSVNHTWREICENIHNQYRNSYCREAMFRNSTFGH